MAWLARAVVASGLLGLAFTGPSARRDAGLEPAPEAREEGPLERDEIDAPPPASTADAPREPAGLSFARLRALRVHDWNKNRALDLRLYRHDGTIDEDAATALDELLADARRPARVAVARLDRRLLQLVFRAAYHFRARRVIVVSAYREAGARGEGAHASGRAIDFSLTGVPTAALAAYLRDLARVGVGEYTDRATSWVHLDVREHSHHWLDASAPGEPSAETPLPREGLDARDLGYRARDDWPESTAPGPPSSPTAR